MPTGNNDYDVQSNRVKVDRKGNDHFACPHFKERDRAIRRNFSNPNESCRWCTPREVQKDIGGANV